MRKSKVHAQGADFAPSAHGHDVSRPANLGRSSVTTGGREKLSKRTRALVLHLDLGIGGAEKLMVNVALAVMSGGSSNINNNSNNSSNNSSIGGGESSADNVTIYTTHHDPSHCFEETKKGGKLGKCISVYGDWLPRSLFGNRFTALCSIVRMVFLVLVVIWQFHVNKMKDYDIIILDGISAPIPLLKLFNVPVPVLFYCHFPDKYLCVERQSILKRAYRYVFDTLEEFSTFCADMILVNSEFTASMFNQAFALGRVYKPMVLYPTIEEDKSIEKGGDKGGSGKVSNDTQISDIVGSYIGDNDYIFLSLNRYERKKGIEKAIEALDLLRNENLPAAASPSHSAGKGMLLRPNLKPVKIQLVIAGGYDERVAENVEYLQELAAMCDQRRISYSIVVFADPQNSKHLGLRRTKDYGSGDRRTTNSNSNSGSSSGGNSVNNNNSRHLIDEVAGGMNRSNSSTNINSSSSSSNSSSSCNSLHDVSVVFRVSISNEERMALLLNATSLLYTPDNEHFGIVPIEAMYLQCPVVAVASGGPKETVRHEETGYLCSNDGKSFSEAMSRAISACVTKVDNKSLRDVMGQRGRQRVLENFTNRVMAEKLAVYIDECLGSRQQPLTILSLFGSGRAEGRTPLDCLRGTFMFRLFVIAANTLYYSATVTVLQAASYLLTNVAPTGTEVFLAFSSSWRLFLLSLLMLLGRSALELSLCYLVFITASKFVKI